MTLNPWTFLMVALAGWMSRQQQEAIEYLRMQNRILREKLGHRSLILNESQKRHLATAAMKLGKDPLRHHGTLLRRHCGFVARKYDGMDGRGPRPYHPSEL